MSAKPRNAYVDILKGLLMFSVVFGHTATALKSGMSVSCGPYPYLPYLRPLDMPLFMAISGYFFYFSCCKRSWQEIMVNRVTMVFIPCVVWIWMGQLVRFAVSPTSLTWVPDGLWFLWSLLMCCGLTVLLHTALGTRCWLGALVMAVLMLFVEHDPYNVGYMFPFFFMGYLTSRWSLLSRFRWWMGALRSSLSPVYMRCSEPPLLHAGRFGILIPTCSGRWACSAMLSCMPIAWRWAFSVVSPLRGWLRYAVAPAAVSRSYRLRVGAFAVSLSASGSILLLCIVSSRYWWKNCSAVQSSFPWSIWEAIHGRINRCCSFLSSCPEQRSCCFSSVWGYTAYCLASRGYPACCSANKGGMPNDWVRNAFSAKRSLTLTRPTGSRRRGRA